jgi:hypothetical protein
MLEDMKIGTLDLSLFVIVDLGSNCGCKYVAEGQDLVFSHWRHHCQHLESHCRSVQLFFTGNHIKFTDKVAMLIAGS